MKAQNIAPRSHRNALAGVNWDAGGAIWTYSGESGVPAAGGVEADDDD